MPNLNTASGVIDTTDLGVTLMHEHVFIVTTEILQNYPEAWGDESKRIADAVARLNELKARGVDTIVDLTDTVAIRLGNQGPGLLIDNTIQSPPAASGPVVTWDALFGADVTSIGNTFTVANPIQNNGRVMSVDDRVIARSEVRAHSPTLSDPLPSLGRRVFEVPANADGRAVQSAIDAAAVHRGARPIVYLPAGVYELSHTLTVPESDVQLAGDGQSATKAKH